MSNNGKFQQVNVTNGQFPELDELVEVALDAQMADIEINMPRKGRMFIHVDKSTIDHNRIISINNDGENSVKVILRLKKDDVLETHKYRHIDVSPSPLIERTLSALKPKSVTGTPIQVFSIPRIYYSTS